MTGGFSKTRVIWGHDVGFCQAFFFVDALEISSHFYEIYGFMEETNTTFRLLMLSCVHPSSQSQRFPRKKTIAWQFFVTFLVWLSDLLEKLSDLQLRDQKVTLNHLVMAYFQVKC